MAIQKISVSDRLKSKVKLGTNGCWNYCVSPDKDGYGRITLRPADLWMAGKTGNRASSCRAARVAYILWVDPIPKEMTVDHKCQNVRCINPLHLRLKTLVENLMLGNCRGAQNARKEVCQNGHALTGDNIYLRSTGSRECRKCKRDYYRQRRAAGFRS